MNPLNFKKMAELRISFWKSSYRLGSLALTGCLAVALAGTPLWGTHAGADDGEKSSRKNKTATSDTTPPPANGGDQADCD